jgi:hypothetical protein
MLCVLDREHILLYWARITWQLLLEKGAKDLVLYTMECILCQNPKP